VKVTGHMMHCTHFCAQLEAFAASHGLGNQARNRPGRHDMASAEKCDHFTLKLHIKNWWEPAPCSQRPGQQFQKLWIGFKKRCNAWNLHRVGHLLTGIVHLVYDTTERITWLFLYYSYSHEWETATFQGTANQLLQCPVLDRRAVGWRQRASPICA